MPLFTVLLEFDGGTHVSQFRAVSPRAAAVKHASHVIGNKAIAPLVLRKRLAKDLLEDIPIKIEGVRNVWCCSAVVGRKLALVNIIETVQT